MTEDKKDIRWILCFVTAISITWVVACLYVIFVGELFGFSFATNQGLNEKGDFLAGFVSPIAFLWLVLGYIQNNNLLQQNNELLRQNDKSIKIQAEELKHTHEAIKLQTEELQKSAEAQKAQADAVRANTNHAAMQTFLMLEKSLVEGLKWSLKKFLMIFYYTEWTKKLVEEKNDLFLIIEASRILVSSITTDEERAFLQNDLITITDRHKNFYYKYRNNEIVSQAIKSYFSTFEILLAEAKKIDTLLNEYYYNIFIDDKAEELSSMKLRKMFYPPDKAKKHYNFEEFHKNSPAGELYRLFKEIIADVEKHNAAQVAQENNPS
jgi:hypothetical protein